MAFWKALENLFNPYITSVQIVGRQQGMDAKPDRSKLLAANRSWVYTCATRNAETCASQALRLYTEGSTSRYQTRAAKHFTPVGRKAAEDVTEITAGHPLLELLDHVNPWMTGPELIECMVLWQELTGDAYLYVEPGPLGVPKNLWPLSSALMKVVPDKTDFISGYLYGNNSRDTIAFKPDEIIHCKYYNPDTPYYGLGVIEAAFGAVSLLQAEQRFEQSLYDSGGMPDVAIITKQRLSKEDEERLRESWKNKWGQGRKASGIPAFLSGEVDIKTLSYPPRDTGIEVSKRFSREDVMAAFGVPSTMIQLSEASKAGADAGMYQYLRVTIQPKLARLAAQLTEQLAARYDPRLILQFDNPTPGDVTERLSIIDTHLRTGYSTINEERAIDGLDPVPWGDEPARIPAALPAMEPEPESEPEEVPGEPEPPKSAKASRRKPPMEVAITDYFIDYTAETVRRLHRAGL